MALEENVMIKITADNKTAEKALKETAQQLQSLESIAKGPAQALGSLANLLNITLPLAAGAAITGLSALIKKNIDYADELNKMAQRTGFSVEQLSSLKLALELNDVTLEKFQSSITRFNVYLQENKKYVSNTYDELLKVADQFASMKDNSEKASLAVKMFGKQGTDLIPLLNQGSEGIKKMAEMSKEFGLVIDTELAVKAEIFNDRLTIMKSKLEGIVNFISVNFLEGLHKIWFFIEGAPNLIKAFFGTEKDLKNAYENILFNYQKYVQDLINQRNLLIGSAFFNEETNKSFEDTQNQIKKLNEEYNKLVSSVNNNIVKIMIDRKDLNNASKDLMKVMKEYEEWEQRFGKQKAERLFERKTAETMFSKEELFKPELRFTTYQEQVNSFIKLNEDKYKKDLELFNYYVDQKVNLLENMSALEIAIVSTTMEEHKEGWEILGQSISGTLSFLSEQNDTWFSIFKAYKKAEALISTYSSAIKAYESLASIPFVGPVLGAAAASAAIAFGLAQVSAINSMQPKGASSGPGISRPALISIPQLNYGSQNINDKKQIVTIHIYGTVFDKTGFSREILPELKKAIKDGLG